MNLLERWVPLGNPDMHKAFGFAGIFQSGKHFLIYREGNEHGVNGQGKMRMVTREADGAPWSPPRKILTSSTRDIRGATGGITRQGTLLVFVRNQRHTGTEGMLHETWCLRSEDEGKTFEHILIHQSDANLLCNFGALVENGDLLMHSFYRTPAYAFCPTSSTDDGKTWTVNVSQTVFPSGTYFTEPDILHLGSNRYICLARDNGLTSSPALFMRSSDGVTWSSCVQVSRLPIGKNPPILNYNPETNNVIALWPSRGTSRMDIGGSGRFWPYYMSYIDADVLWGSVLSGAKWRTPIPLPLYTPYFTDGNSDGDGGYGSIIRTETGRRMFHYKGNAAPGEGGTEFFEVDLESLLAGL